MTLSELSKDFNQVALDHGFWENPNKGERIALMHSELSDALEAIRKPKSSDKLPGFSEEVEEFADCIIRILDYSHYYGLPIEQTVLAKNEYNKKRPYKTWKSVLMSDEKWDRRFLELAKHIYTWSKDPSTKVRAVLVASNNIVVGLGYNGFPRGVVDSNERLNDREIKYQFVVHAEANAILMAGDKAKGATLYVYPSFVLPPICNECAKLVVQSGIKEVIGYEPDLSDARAQRWIKSIEVSRTMCKEAGNTWKGIKE